MLDKINQHALTVLSVVLCFFTLGAVNFNLMQPQSALAVFVGLGLVLCFLVYPLHPKLKKNMPLKGLDWLLALASAGCCGYVVHQTEPFFKNSWFLGQSLGDRAGIETAADFWVGLIGLVLVLEATRRSIGWIVPVLSLLFVLHSYYNFGAAAYGWAPMPDWLLPHAGQSMEGIVGTTFLQSLGVFGPAATVMFKYVFLFVVFGSFLEMSGATQFIIDFAERVFGRAQGGPAQVSVLGSGLMGSLSGSAVANAVTTGAFTIPMMRNAGFPNHVAGGITAAAASGGALVPPVMGAAAYMMLEIVDPQPTFLQIVKAALIPALLYYFSLMVIVHFYSGMLGAKPIEANQGPKRRIWRFEAVVFFAALVVLVGLLVMAFSPFRAVTGSLLVILVLTALRPSLPIGAAPRALVLLAAVVVSLGYWFLFIDLHDKDTPRTLFNKSLDAAIVGMFGLLAFGIVHPAWRPEVIKALVKSSKAGISLVAASACVGIIIGVVQETGIASDFSARIKDVVETNLLVALVGIMVCSLVLGMGVPSVVCYLLMATLMGSLLGDMGVVPLAAHMFIFYFGMMSMVTPPVALAGYASASIADAPIMQTSFAAFRFALVGFTLPFMFIYQPNLLLMGTAEHPLTAPRVALAIAIAALGIVALAAGIVGFLDLFWKRSRLSWPVRLVSFLATAMLLSPDLLIDGYNYGVWVNVVGGSIFLAVVLSVILLPPAPGRPVRRSNPETAPSADAEPVSR